MKAQKRRFSLTCLDCLFTAEHQKTEYTLSVQQGAAQGLTGHRRGVMGFHRLSGGIRGCLQGIERYLMVLAGMVGGMGIGSDSKRGIREPEDRTGRPAAPTSCSPLSTEASFSVFSVILNEI